MGQVNARPRSASYGITPFPNTPVPYLGTLDGICIPLQPTSRKAKSKVKGKGKASDRRLKSKNEVAIISIKGTPPTHPTAINVKMKRIPTQHSVRSARSKRGGTTAKKVTSTVSVQVRAQGGDLTPEEHQAKAARIKAMAIGMGWRPTGAKNVAFDAASSGKKESVDEVGNRTPRPRAASERIPIDLSPLEPNVDAALRILSQTMAVQRSSSIRSSRSHKSAGKTRRPMTYHPSSTKRVSQHPSVVPRRKRMTTTDSPTTPVWWLANGSPIAAKPLPTRPGSVVAAESSAQGAARAHVNLGGVSLSPPPKYAATFGRPVSMPNLVPATTPRSPPLNRMGTFGGVEDSTELEKTPRPVPMVVITSPVLTDIASPPRVVASTRPRRNTCNTASDAPITEETLVATSDDDAVEEDDDEEDQWEDVEETPEDAICEPATKTVDERRPKFIAIEGLGLSGISTQSQNRERNEPPTIGLASPAIPRLRNITPPISEIAAALAGSNSPMPACPATPPPVFSPQLQTPRPEVLARFSPHTSFGAEAQVLYDQAVQSRSPVIGRRPLPTPPAPANTPVPAGDSIQEEEGIIRFRAARPGLHKRTTSDESGTGSGSGSSDSLLRRSDGYSSTEPTDPSHSRRPSTVEVKPIDHPASPPVLKPGQTPAMREAFKILFSRPPSSSSLDPSARLPRSRAVSDSLVDRKHSAGPTTPSCDFPTDPSSHANESQSWQPEAPPGDPHRHGAADAVTAAAQAALGYGAGEMVYDEYGCASWPIAGSDIQFQIPYKYEVEVSTAQGRVVNAPPPNFDTLRMESTLARLITPPPSRHSGILDLSLPPTPVSARFAHQQDEYAAALADDRRKSAVSVEALMADMKAAEQTMVWDMKMQLGQGEVSRRVKDLRVGRWLQTMKVAMKDEGMEDGWGRMIGLRKDYERGRKSSSSARR